MSHLRIVPNHEQVTTLTRLRADPEKLRLSVQPLEKGGWRVELQSNCCRRCGAPFTPVGACSKEGCQGGRGERWRAFYLPHSREHLTMAIIQLLVKAQEAGIPGVDLGMEWPVEHPQRVAMTNKAFYQRTLVDKAIMNQYAPHMLCIAGYE